MKSSEMSLSVGAVWAQIPIGVTDCLSGEQRASRGARSLLIVVGHRFALLIILFYFILSHSILFLLAPKWRSFRLARMQELNANQTQECVQLARCSGGNLVENLQIAWPPIGCGNWTPSVHLSLARFWLSAFGFSSLRSGRANWAQKWGKKGAKFGENFGQKLSVS